MVGCYENSDDGWAQVEDTVSPPQTMGRPRRYDLIMAQWYLLGASLSRQMV